MTLRPSSRLADLAAGGTLRFRNADKGRKKLSSKGGRPVKALGYTPQSQSKEPSGSERRSNGAEAGGAGTEMEPEMGLAEHRARQRGQARAAADALPRLSLD